MKKYIVAIIILIFPSAIVDKLIRLFSKTRGESKYGFSLVLVDDLEINGPVKIGHFCIIKVKSLRMSSKSEIRSFNYIKGCFDIEMGEKSSIAKFNKIVNDSESLCIKPLLKLGNNTHIVANHFFDLTANIIIGDNSLIAGRGTSMWTHHFILSEKGEGRVRIDGDITIGRNVYIGSGCIICDGAFICDNAVIGAGVVVAKKITQKGVYINWQLRHLDLRSVENLKQIACVNGVSVYKK